MYMCIYIYICTYIPIYTAIHVYISGVLRGVRAALPAWYDMTYYVNTILYINVCINIYIYIYIKYTE